MKYTVLLLVGLGIVAAVCAVLLVNALRVDVSAKGLKGEVPILMATRDISAMNALASDDVEVSSMKASEAPTGYFTNSFQVIGKILATPIIEGQVLTKSCLVSEGSSAQLAASLPPGMRAISLN